MRADLHIMADMVTPEAKVLDIGCGKGELLEYLVHRKNVDGRGIELSQQDVSTCVANGLAVIHGNADTDLRYYPEQCFDYAISSQMLQATQHPREVLQEMRRIARKVVISIPNFGYWYNRLYLSARGRMPVSETLPYEWYNTPNIHFCTIEDFTVLCRAIGFTVERRVFLQGDGTRTHRLGDMLPNLFAEQAVFQLGC